MYCATTALAKRRLPLPLDLSAIFTNVIQGGPSHPANITQGEHKMTNEHETSIREAYTVPAHIQACASAIRYDLMHGPAFAAIGPNGIEAFTIDDFASFAEDLAYEEGYTITEVYGGIIENTLREFIDALPSCLYSDWSGCIYENEPEGEWLNDDFEPCDSEEDGAVYHEAEGVWHFEKQDIVAALFGKIIAKEF